MSEHNRTTDPPEERGAVVPTDVKSAGAPDGVPEGTPDGVPEGTPDDAANVEVERVEEGPVRRPLIRATLKHPEGTPPLPREAPVFTMHEQPRGGSPSGRGPGRGGRPVRDGHPNKKKNSRERGAQHASKGNSTGGKKRSPRPDRAGKDRTRSDQPRRDKGRSR